MPSVSDMRVNTPAPCPVPVRCGVANSSARRFSDLVPSGPAQRPCNDGLSRHLASRQTVLAQTIEEVIEPILAEILLTEEDTSGDLKAKSDLDYGIGASMHQIIRHPASAVAWRQTAGVA